MTNTPKIVPLILSGGFGTRLWPASRRRQPKQLLALVDDRTMFRATVDRVAELPGVETPMVVCNHDHRFGIRRELDEAGYGGARMILEPVGRNTAPAVAAAALDLAAHDRDPLLLVLPADHVIRNDEAFAEAVALAAEFAAQEYLVTFGIDPTHPETGYGYIQYGEAIANGVRHVVEFKEKPDRHTAEQYITSGRYLWNSGMFIFQSSTYLNELEKYHPAISAAVEAAIDAGNVGANTIELDAEAFSESPSESIDYAVMERTDRAAVVPMHAGWSDVGSWAALYDMGEHDDDGNIVIGDVETVDVTNSYLRSDKRLLTAIGIDNAVIVDTADAVMVARRDRTQDVKVLVERLREEKRSEFDTDGTEARPWGWFRTLDKGPRFRVLHIWLEPGGKTSLQTHDHRSEYWIVVRGIARVVLGETTRLIPAKDSVFIPAGEVHRLENPEDEPLEVIEVDFGTYVGEDDIRRYADEYGRGERRG
jgi:mannose-1-phosphate guanylyltransferase/mannose-6-phosphate isomerase